MLGEEVERAIAAAWVRVRRDILSDPSELHRRLARRRLKSFTRPPRAWCIAIRASDRRITPAHWIIHPEHALRLDHPLHPYEPIEHEVTIQTHAIRRYCHPVSFSREDAEDVAKMLGVSPSMLWSVRSRARFHEVFYSGLGGKRGKPVPLLECRELLDPGAQSYARPHPIWGSAWEFLNRLFPDNFEQTVVRRPHFARVTSKSRHPEDPAEFWGWRWLCPGCRKQVRTIYYPLPVRTLFDSWFTDPVIQKKLCDADSIQPPPPTFACRHCHGVQSFSTVARGCWNQFIGHVTGGMLYGCEVPKPAAFIPERKRTRTRQLQRQAPMRRKVLTRLSNGWSNARIALDLQISIATVNQHVYTICREEDVPDRHALAAKLRFAHSPPPNRDERAAARRFIVRQMLLDNLSYKEMSQKLGVTYDVIHRDIKQTYRLHGVNGYGFTARRALAQKLNVPFMTHGDQTRQKITELVATGLTYKQVAKQLGLTKWSIWSHMAKLKKQNESSPAPIAAVIPSPSGRGSG